MNKTDVRAVTLIVATAFVATAAGTIYAPTIPLHAQGLGAPEWIVTSLPMGLPSIVSFVLLLPIGIVADRTAKRKEILLGAIALTGIANLGLASSHSWVLLAMWRVPSGLPFALMALFAVVTSFLFPEDRRGSAMALATGGALLGMGLSQALSGSLLRILGSHRGLYLFAAGLGGLAFVLLLPVRIPRLTSANGISGSDIGQVLSNGIILYTGSLLLIYLVGWQMLYGSFATVLVNILGAPLELQTVLFAVASALLGVGTFIWGPVIDRLGARRTLLIGLLGSAMATFALLPFLTSLWVYVILFWITTVGGVCGNPGSAVIATRAVRPELSTIAINMVFLFVTLSAVIGGFAAGPLMAGMGFGVMVLVSGTLQLIGAGMTLGMER